MLGWENNTDLACSFLRVPLGIMGERLRAPDRRSALSYWRGLRGAVNWVLIMPRDASFSDVYFFAVQITWGNINEVYSTFCSFVFYLCLITIMFKYWSGVNYVLQCLNILSENAWYYIKNDNDILFIFLNLINSAVDIYKVLLCLLCFINDASLITSCNVWIYYQKFPDDILKHCRT